MGMRSLTWQICRRQLHSSHHLRLTSLPSVTAATPSSQGCIDVDAFRRDALVAQKPLVFPGGPSSPVAELPALTTWFNGARDGMCVSNVTGSAHPFASSLVPHFQDWPFPYELIKSSEAHDTVCSFQKWLLSSSNITDQVMAGILQPVLVNETAHTFFQIHAPLRLLVKAIEYNLSRDRASSPPLQLYIAQSALPDLPHELQQHLPTPTLVRTAGKGDIYGSSVWLGTEPTYTPLHRDPNPNLFCQLRSKKVVRLMPESQGQQVYFEVQLQIQCQGNSRIRTTDMMEGEERTALYDAVWNSKSPPKEMYEIELDAGDALFIPEGWWHSIRSVSSDGNLNGSANWWFR